jgi:hypothetical protein
MCLGRLLRCVLGAGLFFAGSTLAGSSFAGPLDIVASSVTADPASQQTAFSITFDRKPELYTIDRESDQPIDSFQYFYDAAATDSGISFGPDVSVIRGTEIRFESDHAIPIRASDNPTGEDFPHAEGFGPLRGKAMFELDGATLHFTVPWKVLGETDAKFSYHLIALERGLQTAEVSALVIPLPPGVWAGLTALPVALWAARRLNRGHGRAGRQAPRARRLL